MIESPCFDCLIRYPGCHDACDNYNTYRMANKLLMDVVNKAKAGDVDITHRKKRFRGPYTGPNSRTELKK